MRKLLRKRYISSQITRNINNVRNLWRTFNGILTNKFTSKTPSIHEMYDESGMIVRNPHCIANILNEFFSNIGTRLADDLITKHNNATRDLTVISDVYSSIYIPDFTEIDVRRTIISLKNGSSSDCELTSNLLKRNIDILLPIITSCVNTSLGPGIYPESLKTARLVPIHKSGDPRISENYRPISILPAVTKVFEKLICNTITSFLNKHHIIGGNQYGFQKQSGCISAASHLITELQNSIDIGIIAAAIFVDLKKAFDTIRYRHIEFY